MYGGYMGVDSPDPRFPLKISDSLSVEDVSELIRETTFDPLVPLLYQKSEADALKGTRYALVRRYACEDRDSRTQNEESARALYMLYLGLKVVRPTAGRFQVLHYELDQPTPRLPRGDRNDYATLLCDYECVNTIRWRDLEELKVRAPSIVSTLSETRNPVSQAVQSLEIGYRADFLSVRHLLWVIGVDALFTSTEWENQGTKVSVRRITDFLGRDFEIYSEKPPRDYDGGPALPTITLSEVLRDVYKLRNDFAHGTWPDKQWAGKVYRRSADGSRDIYYAEVLSEAASAVLRGCLKKILADAQLVAMFSEKPKMNEHFASRGLVRKREARIGESLC